VVLCVCFCKFIVVCLLCVQFGLFSSMLLISALMLQEGSLCIATVCKTSNYRVGLQSPGAGWLVRGGLLACTMLYTGKVFRGFSHKSDKSLLGMCKELFFSTNLEKCMCVKQLFKCLIEKFFDMRCRLCFPCVRM